MLSFETARHNIPLLAVAQAQKEVTHNEALVRIDALLHPVAQDELSTPPALTDADMGKCWLVGASPAGDWTGKAGQLAIWIGGGWRFCTATEGMRVRLRTGEIDLIRIGEQWIAPPAIPNPVNGAVVDVEARAAISALLEYLRTIGYVTI